MHISGPTNGACLGAVTIEIVVRTPAVDAKLKNVESTWFVPGKLYVPYSRQGQE